MEKISAPANRQVHRVCVRLLCPCSPSTALTGIVPDDEIDWLSCKAIVVIRFNLRQVAAHLSVTVKHFLIIEKRSLGKKMMTGLIRAAEHLNKINSKLEGKLERIAARWKGESKKDIMIGPVQGVDFQWNEQCVGHEKCWRILCDEIISLKSFLYEENSFAMILMKNHYFTSEIRLWNN